MICYFDASAIVPLLVDEPSQAAAVALWGKARGAMLTHEFGLRGYDAVHCATAELLAVPEFVFASGDKKLLYACEELGMSTADTNAALG